MAKANRDKLKEMLDRESYDPLLEAVQTLKAGEGLSIAERLKANLELCAYLYPKLKAIEVEGKMKTEFNITIQKFGHLLDEREALEATKPKPLPLELSTTTASQATATEDIT